jgi:hypothetical protein
VSRARRRDAHRPAKRLSVEMKGAPGHRARTTVW